MRRSLSALAVLIGVDLGGTKIEAAAVAGDGAALARERTPTPAGDYEATVRAVAALVTGLEARFGAVPGVGVGVPGSPSPESGLIRNANSTCLIGRPLQRDLEAATGRAVRLENDANCLALSEAVDGAGAGQKVVFAVILGTGCGAGLAIDGRILSGRSGVAGEFGHNPLPRAEGPEEVPGPTCWCGRRGCLETYVSGTGLANRHCAATGERLTAEAIVAAARAGDPGARRSLSLYSERLARGLGAVVNLLDPDVIVLGGGMSNVFEIREGLAGRVRPHVFSDVFDTPILPALHGDSSGVRGAAWLWK